MGMSEEFNAHAHAALRSRHGKGKTNASENILPSHRVCLQVIKDKLYIKAIYGRVYS